MEQQGVVQQTQAPVIKPEDFIGREYKMPSKDELEKMYNSGFKDVNVFKNNLTPLMSQGRIGTVDAMEFLLQNGADPNFSKNADDYSFTALDHVITYEPDWVDRTYGKHSVLSNNNTDKINKVLLLIKYGANIETLKRSQKTLTEHTRRVNEKIRNLEKVMNNLSDKSTDEYEALQNILTALQNILKELTEIQNIFDKTLKSNTVTPLTAVQNEDMINEEEVEAQKPTIDNKLTQKEELTKYLEKLIKDSFDDILKKAFSKDKEILTGQKSLILSSAIGGTDLKTLNIILNNPDIDLNGEDEQGMTALIAASIKGHLDIVKRLVEGDTTPGIKASLVNSLVDRGRTNNNFDKKININHVSTKGYTQGLTALSAAQMFGNTEIANYLSEKMKEQIVENKPWFSRFNLFGSKGGKKTFKKSRKSKNQKKRVKSRRTKK